MVKNITLLFCIVLFISCNKDKNVGNTIQNEQQNSVNIEDWDYHEYSPDGRKLYDELNHIDWDIIKNIQFPDNYTRLLSFIHDDEPKEINYIINGIGEKGIVKKINIFSKDGEDYDKRGKKYLGWASVNHLEIEYGNKKLDKELLKFVIYDSMNYMYNNNLILRLSARLLNEFEKPHNYFDGVYLGIIDIDYNENFIKIVVEYVPNNTGVLF